MPAIRATVWRAGEECIAVAKTDGRIIRTDGQGTHTPAPEPRSANGRPKRRR